MVKSHYTFNETKGCGAAADIREGIDTGVLATKMDFADKKAVCFAAVHLSAAGMKQKSKCLENFFKTAEEKIDWTTECDAHFLFGDFSTKTGERTQGSERSGLHFGKGTKFNSLKVGLSK